MKPAEFDAAKKYPLLLQIHGGPAAMWGPGEESMWFEFQYFAARGYAIVYSNPRGSLGYGHDFQKANYQNWGERPAADVLTATDLAAKAAHVDRARQVITGGSYGGYLVAWIVAHDHRFKAAVAQRGVYHLPTFFGEGTAWRLVPTAFGGYPWEPATRDLLERESPFNYVAQIKTPLLIQHGDVDRRTGFGVERDDVVGAENAGARSGVGAVAAGEPRDERLGRTEAAARQSRARRGDLPAVRRGELTTRREEADTDFERFRLVVRSTIAKRKA
jgi:dipeptidyl aminopeptidase/acylaminoacyl peptidase